MVLVGAVACCVATLAARASADSLTFGPNSDCTGSSYGTCGFTIGITVTPGSTSGTYTLVYDITNTSGLVSGYLQSFSVTALTGAVTTASVVSTNPTLNTGTYSLTDNSSGNNGNNNNCTSSNVGGALCLQFVSSSSPVYLTAGAEQKFTVTISDPSGSVISNQWNVKTLVTQYSNTSGSAGAHYVALSASGTPIAAPEPASMGLLGVGFLMVVGVWKLRPAARS
jgi:hypothetical protein